ncbi:carbohydrate binding family 9 domain-containing protein [bacterium]|nr:carbohydrate binding family 9 domain-containing protein [candidate division CSSED10-310 bacterium]
MSYRLFITVLVLVVMLPAARGDSGRVDVTITRAAKAPVIDGVLDDEAWSRVEPITGFMQFTPIEGREPATRTELYITYDGDFFFLAFRCFDSRMDQVRATHTQRESFDNDDVVGFAFDPFNSQREAYLFNVNPYGVVSDFIWHHDGYTNYGWDADIRSRGMVETAFWAVEIAVPFKSLRMPNQRHQVWGFYALRSVKHLGVMDVWPPRTRQVRNYLAQSARLEGLEDIESGRNVTLIPYVFGSYVDREKPAEKNVETGLDLRWGLTSNLMLDLTVNPDYSQIEADPDRLELNERYIEWLPEKRPFFTEGSDLFASHMALFYSRNISDPVVGLKLTGKFGCTRLGFLSAMDEGDGGDDVYYNLVRIKTEVLRQSSIGFLLFNTDDAADDTWNRVAAVDGSFRFAGIYLLKLQYSQSFTRSFASSGCFTLEDENSEPRQEDAGAYTVHIERDGSRFYTKLWFDNVPESFLTRTGLILENLGYRTAGTHCGYFIRQPNDWADMIEFHADIKGRFDFEDDLREEYVRLSTELGMDRFWSQVSWFSNHENVDAFDFTYTGTELELWNTPVPWLDHYLSLRIGGAPDYDMGDTGWNYRVNYNATIKPLDRIVWFFRLSREDFYDDYEGDRRFQQTIAWNKVSCQITGAMFLRAIYQYNSYTELSDASILFSWEYSPLSNLYCGINLDDFRSRGDLGRNVEVFLKVRYLWRI